MAKYWNNGAAYREQAHNKRDKWHPVVTLILYFGTEYKWENPKSLKDSLEIDERIEPFVSDYKLNVFNFAWLTDDEINAFFSANRFKLALQNRIFEIVSSVRKPSSIFSAIKLKQNQPSISGS